MPPAAPPVAAALQVQDEMARRGLCQPGELLDHLRRWGATKGLADAFEQWPRDVFAAAVAEAQAFRDVRRAARKEK